ncbi:MAG TPA: cupin domain-containing protein [Terriglobales bacterium]|nr:cupin domain-containing protein [Terriglobales bacterium]
MFSKLFWAVVFVGLALHTALAQDPTKVEPTHYKLAFENEAVQVLDVHYGPHEKSGMHDHPGGVVVVLTAGHLRFTDENGKTREVFAKPGESRWFPAFKHKVENLGDTSYNAVYIGMKAKPVAGKSDAKGSHAAWDAQTEKILTDYVLASVKRH